MLFKLIKSKKRGSLTVEATLVFPLVIITLLFVANILNICMVHLCMQQALNNTAKKISQYSYLAYRIAGEKNFASVLDSLNNIDDAYSDFEGKATLAKDAVVEAQESLNISMESTANLLHTFDGFSVLKITDYCEKLSENIDKFTESWFGKKNEIENELPSDFSTDGTIGKFKNVQKSFSNLLESGKKNIKSIILKFLIKTGTGLVLTPIAENIFTSYTEKMAVPASRIKETSAFQSSFNPKTGSFTMVVTYKYVNPFSFINVKSMEYSVVNKNIRMANIITIKPFVGKNGTSLVTEVKDSDGENDENVATSSEIKKQEDENKSTPSEIIKDEEKNEMDEKLIKLINEKKFDIEYYHSNNCSVFNVDEDIYIHVKGKEILDKLGLFEKLEPCKRCINNENELKDDDTIYWLRNISDAKYHFDFLLPSFHTETMCDKLKEDRQNAESHSKDLKKSADDCELSLDMFGKEAQSVFANYIGLDLEDINLTKIKINYGWEEDGIYVIQIPCMYCGG